MALSLCDVASFGFDDARRDKCSGSMTATIGKRQMTLPIVPENTKSKM